MVLRGAPLIGIAAAYGVALDSLNGGDPKAAVEKLARTRPTAINLRNALARVSQDLNSAVEIAVKIHEEDAELCEQIAKFGSRLIHRGQTAVTVCNTGALATGGIGTAFGVILRSHSKIKKIYAMETRPYLQGARLTMWEFAKCGMDATLIVDSAISSVLGKEKRAFAISGADSIAMNGDVANKIGTLNLAIAAKYFGIPFYVAAPMTTFNSSAKTGRDIVIEYRDPYEVLEYRGRKFTWNALNPAFDLVPAPLVSAIITNEGLVRKPFNREIRKLFQQS